MNIKTSYEIGSTVWIHGISPSNKLTKGKVIASVDLTAQGYTDTQYVIEIPTHIEPLLEIRPWQTISQDEFGPVGSLRNIGSNLESEHKKISHLGYYIDDKEPTQDEILAALKNSTTGLTHEYLHVKTEQKTQKRKYYPRKKRQ